jgi:hypothetical protein
MKSIHDKPYHKKVYNKDSKNLRVLIGHGSKQPKHAKKGAPYTQNPQKRRPVNKLSAPIIALDEAISEDFKTRFNEIKQATFVVKMKKKVDPYYVTILDKEKTYNGIIKDNNITITNTEEGSITTTKKDFLDRLAEYGELCSVVYCDDSTITIGTKTLTFSEMLKPVEKKPEQPKKGGLQTKKQKQNQSSSAVVNRISKTGNVQQALEFDFFGNFEIKPYHPTAIKFSKKFYKIVDKSLEKIPNKDEKQLAALVAVVFGTLGMNTVSAIAETAETIPKEYYSIAGKAVGALVGTLGSEFEKLIEYYDIITGRKLDKKIKQAKDKTRKIRGKIKKIISGTGALKLPSGDGKKVIFIGNSQMEFGQGMKVFSPFFRSKNYEPVGYRTRKSGALFGTGPSKKGFPDYYVTGAGRNTLKQKIKEEGGADKIGAFCVFLGSYSTKHGSWGVATKKLIQALQEEVPGCFILWAGAPPLQSQKATKSKKKWKKRDIIRKLNSKQMEIVARAFNNVYYINAYDYIKSHDKENNSLYYDYVHLKATGWKKVLNAALAGKKENEEEEVTEESDSETGEVASKAKGLSASKTKYASLIEEKFAAKGFSDRAIAAAIINSHSESALNPYAVGDGGDSVGLFQLNRGSRDNPFWTDSGLDPNVAYQTRVKFRKLCNDNEVRINSSASANLARKGKLANFVKERLEAGDFRFNPEKNVDAILTDFAIPEFKKADGKKEPASQLAYDFAAMVIRCRECKGSEGDRRRERVTKMFPEMN